MGIVKSWLGTTSTDWSDPTNWSPAGVPAWDDLVAIGSFVPLDGGGTFGSAVSLDNDCFLTQDVSAGVLFIDFSAPHDFRDSGFTITLYGGTIGSYADGVFVGEYCSLATPLSAFTGKLIIKNPSFVNEINTNAAYISKLQNSSFNNIDIYGCIQAWGSDIELKNNLEIFSNAYVNLPPSNVTIVSGSLIIHSGATVVLSGYATDPGFYDDPTFGAGAVDVRCGKYDCSTTMDFPTISGGNHWKLLVTGDTRRQRSGNVRAADATNSSGIINASGATDGGNNINFSFVSGVATRFGPFFR